MKRASDVCRPEDFKTIRMSELPYGEDFVVRDIELKSIVSKDTGQVNVLCVVAIDRESGAGNNGAGDKVKRIYASTFSDVLIRELRYLQEVGFPIIASLHEQEDKSVVLI